MKKSPKVIKNNVVIISSSAKLLYEVINDMTNGKKYKTNSDFIKLDNGDFAQVVELVDNK